jgi:hypothetical protein
MEKHKEQNNEDFPIHEIVEDAFGRQRSFLITSHPMGLGYMLRASEEGKDGMGYEFSSFSETSPHNALFSLRDKMHRSLAMRHITRRGTRYQMLHDTLRGRITWSQEDGVALIVDGIPLDLDDLREILETHEGWQFRLDITDPSLDISR